jgi:hypothetical protein
MSIMIHRRATTLMVGVSIAAAAALLATGCGSSDDSSTSDNTDTKTSSSMDSSKSDAAAADEASNGVMLRASVDRLLGEHMLLAVNATQKALLGAKDGSAALDALSANTDELSDTIGSVYGDDAASQFKAQWAGHNGDFVNYTTAVAKQDAAGKAAAVKALGEYQKNFGAFLAKAVGLPAAAVQEQLGVHVGHTAKGVDDFAAKKYPAAYQDSDMGYTHMFAVGDVLATAIAKQQKMHPTTGKAADLQITLDRLLSQHALLAVFVMQRGYDGSADFAASAKALDANTSALGDALGSVYGADAKKAFETQWRAHIQLFVDYVTATAKKDDAAKQKAKDGLDAYQTSFSKFLNTATGLDETAAAESLQMHVEELISSFDSYVDGDYAAAYDKADEAYAHMFETGAALAGAIAKQKNITNDAAMTETSAMNDSASHEAMGM